MKYSNTPKFKVKETVAIIHHRERFKFFIIEIQSVTCYIGTQHYYTGRVISKTSHGIEMGKDFAKFAEIELEKICESRSGRDGMGHVRR